MRRSYRETFTTIKTEGALLPVEILQRIAEGDRNLDGLSPESYHLAKNEKLNEAINRAWNRCEGAWRSFQGTADILPETDAGTTVTRERWLLILFQELGYGRLLTQKAQHINGKSYPISHAWHHTPIHLISFRQNLESRTPGVAGAARMNPHGMVQEFLNRSDDHLWGIVSNGLRLRLLRDNFSLTRQAYVEFDLEAMMSGEVYSDFILLYMVLHQSRVEAERPEQCWLERWSDEAKRRGTRALDQLRSGVQQAIQAFGQGFLAHPTNSTLRQKLQSGVLTPPGLYEQLLRLVYRMIFLFVAEDRDLLLGTDTPPEARSRYMDHYSITRIRRIAGRLRGTQHGDLWQGLRVAFRCLIDGEPAMGLSPLGGFLFSTDALADLNDCDLSNDALLTAVRHLSFTQDRRMLRPVDYRNLGTEELGSVYESLLELHPEVNVSASTFELRVAAGSERKTTGSYYTPSSLIRCLLDSALEPVIASTLKKPDPEKALLDLKVVDPACGSGHFLIAAAHRIGKHLAIIRTGEIEPPPEERRKALRDVVSNCIYGVDVNPLAVELCKVALWIETLDPGRPLGFLDHRIKCGNSLIGATPELLEKGVPDDAFKPIEGDDKKVASFIRKKNKEERKGQRDLFAGVSKTPDWQEAVQGFQAWGAMPENAIHEVRDKTAEYGALQDKPAYQHERQVADLWTAAFFWPLTEKTIANVPTEDLFRRFQESNFELKAEMRDNLEGLVEKHRFFHWHLEFPEVFSEGSPLLKRGVRGDFDKGAERGGFDCVLGNPPWEKTKLHEKEYFSRRDPDIANARNATIRKQLIAGLKAGNPKLYGDFFDAIRHAQIETHFMRNSGRYPYGASGDINTYPLFLELGKGIINQYGGVGLIVKTGILADYSMKTFFAHLVDTGQLSSAYDFSNKKLIFPAVVANERFTLLTLRGRQSTETNFEVSILNEDVNDLNDQSRTWELSTQDIGKINPNTYTCPLFQTKRDAEIVKQIYNRFPVLVREKPDRTESLWKCEYYTMFHMTNDSSLFKHVEVLQKDSQSPPSPIWKSGGIVYFSLLEGKLFDLYDHRHGTFQNIPANRRFGTKAEPNHLDIQQKNNPYFNCLPRYWVPADEVQKRYVEKIGYVPNGVLSFRDVCRTHTDLRTVRSCIAPPLGAGNKAPMLLFPDFPSAEHSKRSLLLCSNMAALVFDYVARQKFAGGSLNRYILIQLPCIGRPESVCQWQTGSLLSDWIVSRALELTYTTWDLEAFARDCGCGCSPFRWDEERRFLIRCELDAAFFHLYGTKHNEVSYILDTFPIFKRKDEQKYGEYRTKRVILECYDAMAEAMKTGRPYQTILDPPAADPSVAHPSLEDVTRAVMIDTAFPRTDAERLLCAATLELIRTVGDMPSEAYLDALYLATHPEHCEVFLPDAEKPKYRRAMKKAPQSLFLAEGQQMNWLRVRDYLETAGAINIADRRGDQRLSSGPQHMEMRDGLPHGVGPIIRFVLKAAELLRAARTDAQARARVSDDVFDQIRRLISQEWRMSA